MKIFSAAQIKEADRITVEKQGISSDELMERAGTLVFEEIHHQLQGRKIPVKIFCGIGNNGGDGLVVGRLLLDKGYPVTIYVVNYSDQRSKNFLTNYDRVKNVTKDWPVLLRSAEDFPELDRNDFVVDAIFGIGLNRPLEPWVAQLIQHINESDPYVLSIDMPSGMFSDAATPKKKEVIKADQTLTFQAPKLAFYLPDTSEFIGRLQILDIGLDAEFLQKTQTDVQLITSKNAKNLYRSRKRNSHKGDYGHALMIGGSHGKMGSISLASKAALRSGAGLVTAFIPKCGYSVLQISVPEAMVLTDKNDQHLSAIEFEIEPSVISFGVGVGKHGETKSAFSELLKNAKNPMVIDADGLDILSEKKELFKFLPESSVLTPHPGESKRLLDNWSDDFDKIEKAREFCKEHKIILVIKGEYTMTVTPEQLYINTTGNPGMATAGSGDVLTGVITGLISQGYEPLSAAVYGVFLHGLSGDIAAGKMGFEAVIAGDIIDHLGPAALHLLSPPT